MSWYLGMLEGDVVKRYVKLQELASSVKDESDIDVRRITTQPSEQ
jgi:hypothetical protein